MKLETNPDIRPHLMERMGATETSFGAADCTAVYRIKVVTGKGHHRSKTVWRNSPWTWGCSGVRSIDAPNPTRGDANGRPPGDTCSRVWGELPAETPAACEGLPFAIPGQRGSVGEP